MDRRGGRRDCGGRAPPARAALPSLVEVEVTHSTTTDPARPQYVHPLDDRSATRRAGGGERGGAAPGVAAGLRLVGVARASGRARTVPSASAAAGRGAAAGARRRRGRRRAAPSTASPPAAGRARWDDAAPGHGRLVARVDATRDEAARQAAIDAGGAARDLDRANDFCDAVPAPKTPHTLRVGGR